ncbi:MAG: hypothetical protein Q7R47_03315 [Candidatus Diapherotrites archaeon]|nr:hypothetical protein [Candidatus Diapherotrites archaeon]
MERTETGEHEMTPKNPTHSPRTRGKSRMVFKFGTNETDVHIVWFKGKHAIVRPRYVPQTYMHISRKLAVQDYAMHRIFHLLFPHNALNPLGVTKIKTNSGEHYGMATAVARNRSPDYKKFQNWHYTGRHWGTIGYDNSAIERHKSFAAQIGVPLARQITSKTGIHLNIHPVNINMTNSADPVFFEVASIDTHKLRQYIAKESLPRKTTQEIDRLLRVLED